MKVSGGEFPQVKRICRTLRARCPTRRLHKRAYREFSHRRQSVRFNWGISPVALRTAAACRCEFSHPTLRTRRQSVTGRGRGGPSTGEFRQLPDHADLAGRYLATLPLQVAESATCFFRSDGIGWAVFSSQLAEEVRSGVNIYTSRRELDGKQHPSALVDEVRRLADSASCSTMRIWLDGNRQSQVVIGSQPDRRVPGKDHDRRVYHCGR